MKWMMIDANATHYSKDVNTHTHKPFEELVTKAEHTLLQILHN